MTLNRRQFTFATGLLPLAPVLRAQETYPSRPITLVVPFSAGSVVDLQARVIARVLAARLGQPIVIDNKVGVSGSIGAEFVSRAAPDGYTLLLGTQGTQGTNSALYKTIRYDPVKDFVAIHGLSGNPNVLVVNPRLGIGSVAELVELAKKNPGKLNFGSGGNGTGGHLCLELLQTRTGARFTHVPYKATSAALVDLVSGNVDAMFDFLQTAAPHIRSGKLRALAVTRGQRMPALGGNTERRAAMGFQRIAGQLACRLRLNGAGAAIDGRNALRISQATANGVDVNPSSTRMGEPVFALERFASNDGLMHGLGKRLLVAVIHIADHLFDRRPGSELTRRKTKNLGDHLVAMHPIFGNAPTVKADRRDVLNADIPIQSAGVSHVRTSDSHTSATCIARHTLAITYNCRSELSP